jgi:CheY-like chemotaxis protein
LNNYRQVLPNFEILLIDDSPADAKIFEEALREACSRAHAYWVASGEEALDFLTQQGRFSGVGSVKLVILDLNMPGIDGFNTLRRIRDNASISYIPIVVFSSAKAQEQVDLAYSLGANAYFSKPLSLERYIEKIRVLVQHWLDLAELPSPVKPQRSSFKSAATSSEAQL